MKVRLSVQTVLRFLFLIVALQGSSLFCAEPARAYIDFAQNQYLIEEVNSQPYRILPRSDRFAIAIDADFFKPVFLGGDNFIYYKWDYYHGNGYWLTARAEFKPVDRLWFNLKTLITQGTSSNGPVYAATIVPLVALTYRETLMGLDFETRLSDIGRQTVGTGLFVEQKDTVGGYIRARSGETELGLMVDGTGSFRLDGGLMAIQGSFWNGIVGFTAIAQEAENFARPPAWTGSLFSKNKWSDGLGYGFEVAGNDRNWAGLGYVQFEKWLGDPREAGLRLNIKPQVRYYGDNVMGDLAGNINHNYVSYEQNDKPYTNFMNIMATGDQVVASAAQVDLEYVFNVFYRIYAETEYLYYNYATVDDLQSMFFRTGFKFFPFKDRLDHFGFHIGNKWLIASSSQLDNAISQTIRAYTPPSAADFENRPAYLQQLYFMVNYTAKF